MNTAAYLYSTYCHQVTGAYTMPIKNWFFPANPIQQYDTHERLFVGLQRLENSAIRCIQTKALNAVKKIVRQYGLPPEQVDDILNQSTLIFLRKIDAGSYQFQNHAPSTYLIEIARRIALSSTRALKKVPETLENHYDLQDPEWEMATRFHEATETIRHLLEQMGEPCGQVIRLHHIEGYSDEEVVLQKMTRYTTVDSLKMKRSNCMKKLIQLAQQWKILNNI